MKFAAIFLVIVVLMCWNAQAQIPNNYYKSKIAVKLSPEFIENLIPDWRMEYVENKFDCSEMSACAQYLLSNVGIKTYICISEIQNHAWVMCETSKGLIAYDVTLWKGQRLIKDKTSYYYKPEYKFDSIIDAYDACPEAFDWWLDAPKYLN